jgi:hypothetical protein
MTLTTQEEAAIRAVIASMQGEKHAIRRTFPILANYMDSFLRRWFHEESSNAEWVKDPKGQTWDLVLCCRRQFPLSNIDEERIVDLFDEFKENFLAMYRKQTSSGILIAKFSRVDGVCREDFTVQNVSYEFFTKLKFEQTATSKEESYTMSTIERALDALGYDSIDQQRIFSTMKELVQSETAHKLPE